MCLGSCSRMRSFTIFSKLSITLFNVLYSGQHIPLYFPFSQLVALLEFIFIRVVYDPGASVFHNNFFDKMSALEHLLYFRLQEEVHVPKLEE